jgi:hypothetical protein
MNPGYSKCRKKTQVPLTNPGAEEYNESNPIRGVTNDEDTARFRLSVLLLYRLCAGKASSGGPLIDLCYQTRLAENPRAVFFREGGQ